MVVIAINIPDDKVEEFKAGFLKAYPNTEGLADIQHVKKFIRLQLFSYYRTGKILIAQETTPPTIDDTVITD